MGRVSYHPDRSKYTRELMEVVVRESRSYIQVLNKLGLRQTGSANTRIREIIRVLGLDTSHFTGIGSNRGSSHVGGPKKKTWQEILVRDRFGNGRKEPSRILRRALIESGVPEFCKHCGCGTEWNGKPLSLQIDHVDGNCIDNTPTNLRFLCPNCHSQTSTFGSKNFKRNNAGWRKKGKTVGKKRIWKEGKRITVYESSGGETAAALRSGRSDRKIVKVQILS